MNFNGIYFRGKPRSIDETFFSSHLTLSLLPLAFMHCAFPFYFVLYRVRILHFCQRYYSALCMYDVPTSAFALFIIEYSTEEFGGKMERSIPWYVKRIFIRLRVLSELRWIMNSPYFRAREIFNFFNFLIFSSHELARVFPKFFTDGSQRLIVSAFVYRRKMRIVTNTHTHTYRTHVHTYTRDKEKNRYTNIRTHIRLLRFT